MTAVEFKLAEDRNSVVMEIDPSHIPVPDPETVRNAFRQSEYSAFFLMEEAVSNALASLAKRKDPDDAAEPLRAMVAQRKDAELKIDISDDQLSATASITAAHGGKHTSSMDVAIALRAAGVTTGLLMENIADLVRQARNETPGGLTTATIAQGNAPKDGTDARFEQLAATMKDRVLKPRENQDGSVDMRELGDLLTVAPDTPLMRRHPPGPGQDGLAVTGEVLGHEPGSDNKLIAGDGTAISREDPDLLLAARSGIPKLIDGVMQVDETLMLDRVDLSTGNIEFEGSIVVRGDVAEDMRIHAHGDLSIGGVVESAEAIADGDLIVGDGVIGHNIDADQDADAQYSVKLWAGRDLHAKYAQNAELHSGRSVRIANYLFHSRVRAGEGVWIGGEKHANGRLVGGELYAGISIQAGIIGTPGGTKSRLDLSPRVAEVQSRLDELKTTQKDEILRHNTLVGELKRLQLAGREQAPKRKQIGETLKQMREEIQQRETRLAEVQEEKAALLDQIRVVATRSLYPAITVIILDESLNNAQEHGPCKVQVKEEEIKIEPIS